MTSRPQRRSAHVAFLLVGAAAMTVAGCGEDSPDRVFTSLDSCRQALGVEACQSAFQAAIQEHLKEAPRFTDPASCQEATEGNSGCMPVQVQQPDGSLTSVFMPAMMGFLVGRALSGGGGAFGAPVVVDQNGYYRRSGSYGGYNRLPPQYETRRRDQQASGGFGGGGGLRDARAPSSASSSSIWRNGVGTSSSGISRGGFGASAGRASGGG